MYTINYACQCDKQPYMVLVFYPEWVLKIDPGQKGLKLGGRSRATALGLRVSTPAPGDTMVRT